MAEQDADSATSLFQSFLSNKIGIIKR